MAADCRARCVDGADLGADLAYARMIANVDPRCPIHGEPDAVMAYVSALEKVAETARDGMAGLESGDLDMEAVYDRITDALAELKELD